MNGDPSSVAVPPEFAALTQKQARYALARRSGLSNARAAEFAGYATDNPERLRAIGWQLSRHPAVIAAMAALERVPAPTTTTHQETDHDQA